MIGSIEEVQGAQAEGNDDRFNNRELVRKWSLKDERLKTCEAPRGQRAPDLEKETTHRRDSEQPINDRRAS